MTAAAAAGDDAQRAKKLRQAQMLFDFRLPAGEWLTFKQIGAACGRDAATIARAFDTGKLLGNRASMSGKTGGDNVREHGRVHRDEAMLFLLDISNYGLEEYLDHLERIYRKMPKPMQHQFLQRIAS